MNYLGQPADYKNRIALSYFRPFPHRADRDTVRATACIKDFVAQHGYGVQHLGLLVEDMETAIAQAEEAGFKVIMDGAGFGPDGDGHYAYLDTRRTLRRDLRVHRTPQAPPYPTGKGLPARNGRINMLCWGKWNSKRIGSAIYIVAFPTEKYRANYNAGGVMQQIITSSSSLAELNSVSRSPSKVDRIPRLQVMHVLSDDDLQMSLLYQHPLFSGFGQRQSNTFGMRLHADDESHHLARKIGG